MMNRYPDSCHFVYLERSQKKKNKKENIITFDRDVKMGFQQQNAYFAFITKLIFKKKKKNFVFE